MYTCGFHISIIYHTFRHKSGASIPWFHIVFDSLIFHKDIYVQDLKIYMGDKDRDDIEEDKDGDSHRDEHDYIILHNHEVKLTKHFAYINRLTKKVREINREPW